MRATTKFGLRLGMGLVLAAAAICAQATLPIQAWTAKSGARVLFVESRSIPMLDISVDFDAGSRRDPPGKAGLASMTNAMLFLGAEGLSENAIAERLADTGAQRGNRVERDRAGAMLRTLSARAEREASIALLAAVLSAPTFPEAVLTREKARVSSALKEAETRPETIGERAFAQALYGTHPYGQTATTDSIASISRADLEAFYRAHHAAARAVVAMIGDVSRAEAEAIAERLTANLPAGSSAPTLPPLGAPDTAPRRIGHPATQAHIFLGAPALARGDPDFFALTVGNYILGGGGFVSRLMNEVREKRGLAYSVYSYFQPLKDAGPFQVGLQTKKEQADEALALVKRVVAEYVARGPTAAELKAAKDNLVGGFALRIDNNRKILDNLGVIGFYGLPADYLDRWSENVARVTAADIRAAFARKVKPESFATVVVGAPEAK
ncbi:MAG: insulinase family protein [Burkholderiales bacterium]|nr:insulinase family protein [Burkholderiales bacterium]